jgi:hypothetical protein
MVEQAKWVGLQFDFTMPAGKFPALLERLAGTPARMEEKLLGLTKQQLTAQHNGGWSAQEHAGHLLDLEELIENRLNDFEAGKEVLTAADMTNKKTYEANHNVRDIKNILADFRKARIAIVKRMGQYDEAMVIRTALHPRLNKPMRIIDLAFFSAEHDDHHLASMEQLIRL